MGLADIFQGAFGGLSQGLGNFQKLKNDEADRLTQAKQLKLQEAGNVRADAQNARQEIEFKRQQAQAFLDAQTDDAEFDLTDPNVQMALETGLKSSFTAGTGPNKLKIKMTPQRMETAKRLQQLDLALEASRRTNRDQDFQLSLKDSILKSIEDGSFESKPVYERMGVLARAGLPGELAMNPAEATKLLKEQSMVSPSVIGAGISAGASRHATDTNAELWRSGARQSTAISDDKIFSAEEYASALNDTVAILQKSNRQATPVELYKAASELLAARGMVPPSGTPASSPGAPKPAGKPTVTRIN